MSSELLTPPERRQLILRWDRVDAFTALCWVKAEHPDVFDAAAAAVGRVHGRRAGGRSLGAALVAEVRTEGAEATP